MKNRVLPTLCLSFISVGVARAQVPALGNLPPSLPPSLKTPAKKVAPVAKPVAAKPVAAKPVDVKPVVAKPVEINLVVAKPVVAKPVAVVKAVKKTSPYQVLEEYSKYGETDRPNRPEGYIAWLKEHRFTKGELDGLPHYAIILHSSDVVSYLGEMGYGRDQYYPLDIGSSDPNLLYVVKRKYGASFIVNRGLPGAGGITSQTAELGALGVQYVIHVGTCGVLGSTIREQSLILARASYKDGGAILLSSPRGGKIDQLAYPDPKMAREMERLLHDGQQDYVRSTGFTIPVFYFQPSGLVQSLFGAHRFASGARPGYVEMEEAAFFMAAEQMKMSAASLLIGTDRYLLESGKLTHKFHSYDPTAGRLRALLMAVQEFDAIEQAKPVAVDLPGPLDTLK